MNSGIAELLANPYTSRALAVIFGATLIFFSVVSIVLFYHWKRYEPANSRIIFAAMLYFGGSIILFGGAAYYLFLFIK